MIHQLKHSFFQVFGLVFIWVTFLLTIFFGAEQIAVGYLWHIVGICVIFGVMFGVVYQVLWNFLTLKPIWNILISSVLNILMGMSVIWLFSVEMFDRIFPWLPGMIVLEIVLHILAFYVYAKLDAKKQSNELNQLLKNDQE